MKLIVACDPTGGIGYNNKLPWSKIEGDLPRFKSLTEDKIVVMGRNTWESLPKKPLPNRTNFVVTSNPFSLPYQVNHEKVYAITNLNTLNSFNENACLIGGAKLIESAWQYITTIHLTKTFAKYTCDTYIDLLKLEKDFILESSIRHIDHYYQIYNKK